MPVIFLDELIAVNFLVDYLILNSAVLLAGKVVKKCRMAISALVGAIYAAMVSIYPNCILSNLSFQLLISFIMIIIPCGMNTKLFKMCISFFAVSFLFGGSVFALECILGTYQDTYPLLKADIRQLIAAIGISWAMIKVFLSKIAGNFSITKELQLTIVSSGSIFNIPAVYDTGNRLKDPFSGKAAIIVDRFTASKWFPEQISKILLQKNYSAERMLSEIVEEAGSTRFGIIPFRTVGENGLMLTYRADTIKINGTTSKSRLVGIAPNKLSEDGSIVALVG